MSNMDEATASLVVLEVVRIQGNGELRLSPDQLHSLILEALSLNNDKEIPYASANSRTGRDAEHASP